MNNSIPDQVADKMEQAKKLVESLAIGTSKLYKLRCFESMSNPQTGQPIVTRVPGGWLFYQAHGGGSMTLHMGEGTENDPVQQVVGQQHQNLTAVFVPYDKEFLYGPYPHSTRMSSV